MLEKDSVLFAIRAIPSTFSAWQNREQAAKLASSSTDSLYGFVRTVNKFKNFLESVMPSSGFEYSNIMYGKSVWSLWVLLSKFLQETKAEALYKALTSSTSLHYLRS